MINHKRVNDTSTTLSEPIDHRESTDYFQELTMDKSQISITYGCSSNYGSNTHILTYHHAPIHGQLKYICCIVKLSKPEVIG